MKNLFCFLLTVLSLGLISCSAQDGGYQNVDASEFAKHVKEHPGTVLDVRTPGEVAAGTLPNAVHINVHDADFAQRAGKLAKDQPVYVYCKAGGRSARAAKQLVEMGFKDVYNLSGGITAWKSAGNKIVTQ